MWDYKIVATSLFDSDELISEENKEKYFMEAVIIMRAELEQLYGVRTIVNDLKIHEEPSPVSNIKVAIYRKESEAELKAYVYN